MIWHSFEVMTIADVLIIGSICFAIYSFFRLHGSTGLRRPNLGLLMVLFGLTLIAAYYLLNLAIMHVLPHFMKTTAVWSTMRNLHASGYWMIIGFGVITMVMGLHLVNRNMRALVAQLRAAGPDSKDPAVNPASQSYLPIPQIGEPASVTEEQNSRAA